MSDIQAVEELWATMQKRFPSGEVIAEGKTKVVRAVASDPNLVVLTSKDDITAGNGAKHDIIPNKAKYCIETTCNVFEGLKNADMRVAYVGQYDETSYLGVRCSMIPCEIVVRMEAAGSYCRRHSEVPKGTRFSEPIVEFNLKTTHGRWKEHELICDDPLMRVSEEKDELLLFDPEAPDGTPPFLILATDEVFSGTLWRSLLRSMANIVLQVGMVLEALWEREGGRLVDLKIECGLDVEGNLLLADEIDNDCWRVVMDNAHVDKQPYRDGTLSLEANAENYRRVAEITFGFRVPLAPWVLPKKGHALG